MGSGYRVPLGFLICTPHTLISVSPSFGTPYGRGASCLVLLFLSPLFLGHPTGWAGLFFILFFSSLPLGHPIRVGRVSYHSFTLLFSFSLGHPTDWAGLFLLLFLSLLFFSLLFSSFLSSSPRTPYGSSTDRVGSFFSWGHLQGWDISFFSFRNTCRVDQLLSYYIFLLLLTLASLLLERLETGRCTWKP